MNASLKQFLKYVVVGGSGVLINTGVTFALTEYMNVWYVYSNWIGIGIAFLSNYTWSKLWVFKR